MQIQDFEVRVIYNKTMMVKIINMLKNKLLLRRRARWLLLNLAVIYLSINNKLPPKTKLLYQYFAAHDESLHIVSELDAAILYNLVLKYKPKNCIDLGSGLGTSAAMVAHAMERNSFGRVKSFEQLEWMADEAKKIIDYKKIPRVSIKQAECVVEKYFGQDFACYEYEYDEQVDMVIVDGPFHLSNIKKPKSHYEKILPNGDLFRLLPYLNKGAIVFVDARLSSVAAYRKYLRKDFIFSQSRVGYTLMKYKG